MPVQPPIITLMTDFGTDDFFVAAMKGVILTINPSVTIVDVTHTLHPHDIQGAAFTLAVSYREFPPGTTHVVVVDPGVGSPRKPIIVTLPQHTLVGPDNGVFSYVYADQGVESVIHITADQYFRHPSSDTFHGRDIFAPVAAWLTKGLDPASLGSAVTEFVRFDLPCPQRVSPTLLRGYVIHIDRFGNLITNFTHRELPPDAVPPRAHLIINGHMITRWQTHFAQVPSEDPFAYFGSTGRWEIAVYMDSAQRALNASVGTLIDLLTG